MLDFARISSDYFSLHDSTVLKEKVAKISNFMELKLSKDGIELNVNASI